MFRRAIHHTVAVGEIAADQCPTRVTEPERVIVALQFIADETIVMRKRCFNSVRHIVVQRVPIKRVVVARAFGRIALINSITGKIRRVAHDNGTVAVDENNPRRFAAHVMPPIRTAAIVVIRRIVLDAIIGRLQEPYAPPAIAVDRVRTQNIPPPPAALGCPAHSRSR